LPTSLRSGRGTNRRDLLGWTAMTNYMADCRKSIGYTHRNVSRLQQCESEWQDAFWVLCNCAGTGSCDSFAADAAMSTRAIGRGVRQVGVRQVRARGMEHVG
jgi:hypothetical protein